MNKVYIVEANFEDQESSWWSIIGLFTCEIKAKESEEKWFKFFTKNEKMFNPPNSYQSNYYQSCYGDDSSNWFDSDEYYELKSDFRNIKYFTEISIREYKLDEDILIDSLKTHSSEKMINLMNQWNRNYKINELIK